MIDFISDLPFMQVWKPLVKKRVKIKIERRSFLLKCSCFVFDNRVCTCFLNFVEQLRWKKKARS